jgi:hypothetical protein
MLAFMLDPHLKHFSLVGDYVGHASAIDITYTYDAHFFLPTLQKLYQKMQGQLVTSNV